MKKQFISPTVKLEIQKRKGLFENSTLAQKRVLIAYDVLEQIKSGKMIPSKGKFVTVENMKYTVASEKESVQVNYLSNKLGKCNCCAFGGLLLSCTLFKNQSIMSDLNFSGELQNPGEIVDYNKGFKNGFDLIFQKSQLKLIELTFELGRGYFNNGLVKYSKLQKKAIAFGDKFENVSHRMKAIMYNIIANNGRFIP